MHSEQMFEISKKCECLISIMSMYFAGYSKTNPILATQDFLFRGATDEKSDFILNFLKELNIDRYTDIH